MITAQKTFRNCPDQSVVDIRVLTDTSGGGSVEATCLPRVNGVASPPEVDPIATTLSRRVTSPNRFRFNVFINFRTVAATATVVADVRDPNGTIIETFAKRVASDQDRNARISIAVLTQLPPAPAGNGGVQ